MTCGAAARTAMVAMIVKAVNVMRQSLSNTCSGDLEDEDEDVQCLGGDLKDDENSQDDEDEDGDDLDDHEYVGDFDV